MLSLQSDEKSTRVLLHDVFLSLYFLCFVWFLDVSFVFDIQVIHHTENIANIFLSSSISNEDNITFSFTQRHIFNQRNIVI